MDGADSITYNFNLWDGSAKLLDADTMLAQIEGDAVFERVVSDAPEESLPPR